MFQSKLAMSQLWAARLLSVALSAGVLACGAEAGDPRGDLGSAGGRSSVGGSAGALDAESSGAGGEGSRAPGGGSTAGSGGAKDVSSSGGDGGEAPSMGGANPGSGILPASVLCEGLSDASLDPPCSADDLVTMDACQPTFSIPLGRLELPEDVPLRLLLLGVTPSVEPLELEAQALPAEGIPGWGTGFVLRPATTELLGHLLGLSQPEEFITSVTDDNGVQYGIGRVAVYSGTEIVADFRLLIPASTQTNPACIKIG
jgi:hypothetical protein